MAYFMATDETHGKELWRSDGTASGTILVADVYEGTYSSLPREFTAAGNTLFFHANDGIHGKELWALHPDVVAFPRVASIVRAGASPTTATTVDFTVTFDDSVTHVDAGDFALTLTGNIDGASVATVAIGGSVYTVTVDTGTGNGTLRLDVADNDSIIDGTGNPLGGPGAINGDFTDGEAYEIAGRPTGLAPTVWRRYR